MSRRVYTAILILVFLTGLSLLLYPAVSDYWNSFHQSRAIASYVQNVAAMENDTYEEFWQAADAYNETLHEKKHRFFLSAEEALEYAGLLNPAGSGIMAYVEIPSIKCSLPVYHGTDGAVLQIAAGHIEGSSLPVGGKGTHCVISGHRGLPSAKLFSDLDRLQTGDLFLIKVLDEVLTYEVDRILIVEPDDSEGLELVSDQDYCTLVTCTPYGINSHRLLVRGVRTDNRAASKTIRVSADAIQIEPILVAPFAAAPVLLLLLILVMLPKKRRHGGKTDENK